MGAKFTLEDGKGTGTKAKVEKDSGALSVINRNIPPVETDSPIKVFRQFFTDDGTATGSEDMQVVGSLSTTFDFFIPSSFEGDRYIDSIGFLIADGGATLNKFGNITALTNGCELFIEDDILGNVIIHTSLKSNFDFVRLCLGQPSFGTGTASFRGSNVIGSFEAYIPHLDFSSVFGLPWGLKIPKNSDARIVMRIKDDTTGIEAFDMIAYGYDRIHGETNDG